METTDGLETDESGVVVYFRNDFHPVIFFFYFYFFFLFAPAFSAR